MATVTGNLNDITGGLMDSRGGIVQFTLNQGNIRVNGDNVIPDNTRGATPKADGSFSISLEPTDQMALDAWYTVSVLWLQQDDSGFKKPAALASYLDLKIRVPSSGGSIGQLIDPTAGGGVGGANPNNRIVWVSQTAPSNPRPFMLWLKQEPGPNPDPFDSRNTSDLYEWRP